MRNTETTQTQLKGETMTTENAKTMATTLKWIRIVPGRYTATDGEGRKWIVSRFDGKWDVWCDGLHIPTLSFGRLTTCKELVGRILSGRSLYNFSNVEDMLDSAKRWAEKFCN